MLTKARGVVTAITRADAGSISLTVLVDGVERRVLAYPALCGEVAVGDSVVLNTTATQLALGTGGLDFVLHNETRSLPETVGDPDGHIVKLRYTPLQHAVETAEMDPANAPLWEAGGSLMQTPVVIGLLHSQIAPAAAAIRAARENARIAYIMTDAAALPLALSGLVRDLRLAGLIDITLTAGQAFGGDYECVTVASALICARWIARADVILISQGPGNAGTGTRFGFSGIEQGPLLDLAGRLWGTPIGILRLSLADSRSRHRGLSHHSVTALGLLCNSPALVAFPTGDALDAAELKPLREMVDNSPIGALHRVEEADGSDGLALLAQRGVRVTSMGRLPEQDPVFFHAAAAAGALAARHIRAT